MEATMMTTRHTDVRTAQAALRSVYALAPQAARVASHATTVDRDPSDPFRATVFVGSGDADVVPVAAERAIGGPNGAPSAGDLFCAALAASQDSAIRIAANTAGIRLAALSVDVRAWVDVRGTLGIDRDVPVGFQTMECTVRIQAAPGTDAEAVRRMLIEAESRSIVLATLRHILPVHVRIEQPASAPMALAA
jgi:uncharacterized OsmC-like protein